MAELKLTEQQHAAVYDRGGSLLLSAAAGSGKTKVLVERVFSYLTQERCDVDDFLIITFTRAAAAELRARLAAELSARVAASRAVSQRMACWPPSSRGPHMARSGRSWPQTAGRSGRPKRRQRKSASSCTQRTPAGLPCGMPGMAELMDGAMQQAPQPVRQADTAS